MLILGQQIVLPILAKSKVKVGILVNILKIIKILVNMVNHPDFEKWDIFRKIREIEQIWPKFRLPLTLPYPRTVVPNTKKMVINIDLLNYWSNRKMVFPKIEKRDLIFKKNVSVVTLF